MSSKNHRARGKPLLLSQRTFSEGRFAPPGAAQAAFQRRSDPGCSGVTVKQLAKEAIRQRFWGPAHESAREISSGSLLQLRKPQSHKARFQQVGIEAYSFGPAGENSANDSWPWACCLCRSPRPDLAFDLSSRRVPGGL
jgi:hypothetical protein